MAATRRRKLVEAGTVAPPFRLPKLGGGETTLEELAADAPVLLAFYKVTCPVCQLAFPYLERLFAGGKLKVYGINQNDPEEAQEFNQEFGITFPTLLDNEETDFVTSNAYGISSVPTAFLIGPGGKIERVIEGWSKRDMEWLGQQSGVNVFRQGDSVPEWKAG
jgi:peroxiredoxin